MFVCFLGPVVVFDIVVLFSRRGLSFGLNVTLCNTQDSSSVTFFSRLVVIFHLNSIGIFQQRALMCGLVFWRAEGQVTAGQIRSSAGGREEVSFL